MKTKITILMLLSMFSVSGQCKIKTNYDKFKKQTTHNIEAVGFFKGMKGFQLSFYKGVTEEATNYGLVFMIARSGCLSPRESYIDFLLKDGSVIKLLYNSEIECGATYSYFTITEAQLNELRSQDITDVRIHYDSSYDAQMSDKHNIKFKDNVNCILAAR